MINTYVGRLAVRDEGHDKQDNAYPARVIVGALHPDQQFFKPGMVYEMMQFGDQLVIQEIGKSLIRSIGEPYNEQQGTSLRCWSYDIADVYGINDTFMTREEVKEINAVDQQPESEDDFNWNDLYIGGIG